MPTLARALSDALIKWGMETDIGFRLYPEVTLVDARDLRPEARRVLLDGQDDGQTEPTFECVDIRDVRDPNSVWLVHVELPLQLFAPLPSARRSVCIRTLFGQFATGRQSIASGNERD